VAGALDEGLRSVTVEDVATHVAAAYAPVAEGRLDARDRARAEALRAAHSQR
jgi:hypothetical protein